MATARDRLHSFFRAHAGEVFASGDIQRMEWRNKNATLATPRSIVRRLEELTEEGILKVEYKERNHAFYSFGDKMRTIYDYALVNGVRIPQARQIPV